MKNQIAKIACLFALILVCAKGYAANASVNSVNHVGSSFAWAALICFLLAYFFVFSESRLNLKKSKPMLVASGLIWVFVAMSYGQHGDTHTAEVLFRKSLEFYIELFLFLLASTTFVNAMSERGVFAVIRQKIMAHGKSFHLIFWISGLLTFVFSAFLANFAVALVLATVVIAIGADNKKFIVCGCVNLVVAANAGGSFSPFGDVTTLMIWQSDLIHLWEFPRLFIPSVINWLIPAIILSFGFPANQSTFETSSFGMSKGGWLVSMLFVATLFLSVIVKHYFHLPAVIGMMTGLGVLKLYGYYLKRKGIKHLSTQSTPGQKVKYDIFRSLERSEWDTLIFLYGILISISGLAALGYLHLLSDSMYGQIGATYSNIILGILSAFFDNTAIMYSVIAMHPEMSHWQWLLITLTASVGGSLLVIGSAAGIAIMGISQGQYTFSSHLRYSWAIALGYVASIITHYLLNY